MIALPRLHTFCYLKLPQNNIRISRTPNLSLTQEFGVVNENTLLISQTQTEIVVLYLPKIIPPFDGHEVAKPLMSHFMSNHLRETILKSTADSDYEIHIHHGHPFLVDCWTFRGIIDEVGFPVRDQAPMLGCTATVIRDGSHVKLGQWIRYAKVSFVVIGNGCPDIFGIVQQTSTNLRLSAIDPEGNFVFLGNCINEFEITDNEDGQICYHGHGLFKHDLGKPYKKMTCGRSQDKQNLMGKNQEGQVLYLPSFGELGMEFSSGMLLIAI